MLVAIFSSESSTCQSDVPHKHNTNDETGNHQGHINRDWISVKWAMSKRIQPILREIDESRNADDCSIDPTESCKAKDLRRVVAELPVSISRWSIMYDRDVRHG